MDYFVSKLNTIFSDYINCRRHEFAPFGLSLLVKYLFANLHNLQQTFDVSLEWNYFATSHGKGAVDGVGGCVKRSVWSRVKAGKLEARNAVEFFNAAVASNSTVKVVFVTKEEIVAESERLAGIWTALPTLPGTHGVHYVQPKSATEILYSQYTGCSAIQCFNFETREIQTYSETPTSQPTTSASSSATEHPDSEVEPTRLVPGKLVAVAYECDVYIGSIETLDGDEMLVNFMIAANGSYKWPGRAKPQPIHFISRARNQPK